MKEPGRKCLVMTEWEASLQSKLTAFFLHFFDTHLPFREEPSTSAPSLTRLTKGLNSGLLFLPTLSNGGMAYPFPDYQLSPQTPHQKSETGSPLMARPNRAFNMSRGIWISLIAGFIGAILYISSRIQAPRPGDRIPFSDGAVEE